MIFPKPYSIGGGGSIIFGRSDTYDITEATIQGDLDAGRASISNQKITDIINLFYSNFDNYNEEKYHYFLIPNAVAKTKVYAWQADYFSNENPNYTPLVPFHSNQRYGLLYNWYVALDPIIGSVITEDREWILPTAGYDASHFLNLITEAGGNTVAGLNLKGQAKHPLMDPRWSPTADTGDNTVGFSAYPNGYRNDSGAFYNSNTDLYIWGSATMNPAALNIASNWDNAPMFGGFDNKYGFSIRFVSEDVEGYDDGDTGTITDVDGNVYGTIRIGNLLWMTENLCVTRYADGRLIPFLQSSSAWSAADSGAFCVQAQTYYGSYPWWVETLNFSFMDNDYHLPRSLYRLLKMKTFGVSFLQPKHGLNRKLKLYSTLYPDGYNGLGSLMSTQDITDDTNVTEILES